MVDGEKPGVDSGDSTARRGLVSPSLPFVCYSRITEKVMDG